MADNRDDELTPQARVDIDHLINTLAAHKVIDSPAMRSARTTGVRRATKGIQKAYGQEEE